MKDFIEDEGVSKIKVLTHPRLIKRDYDEFYVTPLKFVVFSMCGKK